MAGRDIARGVQGSRGRGVSQSLVVLRQGFAPVALSRASAPRRFGFRQLWAHLGWGGACVTFQTRLASECAGCAMRPCRRRSLEKEWPGKNNARRAKLGYEAGGKSLAATRYVSSAGPICNPPGARKLTCPHASLPWRLGNRGLRRRRAFLAAGFRRSAGLAAKFSADMALPARAANSRKRGGAVSPKATCLRPAKGRSAG